MATSRHGPHTKGSYVLFFFFAECRPISITPVLFKVFQRLLAVPLQRNLESEGFFPTCQFAYRKGQGNNYCDALLSISQFGQEALEVGGECSLLQIYFSAAFDRVNHDGLMYSIQSVGIGEAILGTICQFSGDAPRRSSLRGSLAGAFQWCLGCHRAVFWVHCCSCCTLLS